MYNNFPHTKRKEQRSYPGYMSYTVYSTCTVRTQHMRQLIDVERLVNEWIRRKNLLPYNRNETIGRVLQFFRGCTMRLQQSLCCEMTKKKSNK